VINDNKYASKCYINNGFEEIYNNTKNKNSIYERKLY